MFRKNLSLAKKKGYLGEKNGTANVKSFSFNLGWEYIRRVGILATSEVHWSFPVGALINDVR